MSLTMLSPFLLLGLATVSTVRRRRCLQDRGGRQVEWSITDHPGCWFWGSGEIFVGSSSIDAMEPASAVVSFWRASGVPPLHYPVRTRKNPRTSPGSNIAITASLVECVAWYAVLRCAGNVVGLLQRVQWLQVIFVFVELPV
jgi:hypothetical protein